MNTATALFAAALFAAAAGVPAAVILAVRNYWRQQADDAELREHAQSQHLDAARARITALENECHRLTVRVRGLRDENTALLDLVDRVAPSSARTHPRHTADTPQGEQRRA